MRAALKDIPSEKTDFGPGKTPLYYNNKGLFSDPFIEERLPNLEKYSSHPSTKYLNKYWNCDEFDHVNFSNAFQEILDLWSDKLDEDVPKYCQNEAQLEQSWIKPILEILGWSYEVQDKIDKRGRKMWPDYSLFASEDAWKKSKNSAEAKKFFHATSVADAKAWDVSLDGKGYTNANPSFQIVTYMELTKKDWGILTNGREWRVYSLRSDSKHTTYFEIDLINILATKNQERFKYFYNFFRKEAFVKEAAISDRCFLDFVFEDGQFYSQKVEENLQGHAYKVVDTICQGFLANIQSPTDEDLKEVYEYSMYYLFKLMFVLNCESKGLLEVNKQDDYYEFSLRKRVLDLKEMHQTGKNWSSRPSTYNFINDLFELLKHGDKNIGVHGFGEEPFEIGSIEFYLNNKITDEYLNDALIDLACSYDEDDNLQFIDYKILSPDHIGSLFEGLLEFQLIRNKNKVELLNTKGERKATGSYYTPEYLVDYIIEKTFAGVTEGKSPKEIIDLKVLDPSMGSGHFLLGVVKFLEKIIIKYQEENPNTKTAIEYDKIRREVLHNCVFGIDINPLATQLAKFSLWIYSSNKGDTLEPLNDQLLNFDSLSDDLDWEKDFQSQVKNGLFDVVVGNPPYVGESGNKETFRRVKQTRMGKRFYQGKMDLLYFFLHLGLEHLKINGRLGMITTNYYFTADGAFKLRQDLRKRATLTGIVNFNEFKIFKGATGQHNAITFLNKGTDEEQDCHIVNYVGRGAFSKDLLDGVGNVKTFGGVYKNKNLYFGDSGSMKVNASMNTPEDTDVIKKMQKLPYKVSDFFYVNQGIVTGLNRIGKKHVERYPNINLEKNEGVFILQGEEAKPFLRKKELSKYVKPLFKNTDIDRFSVSKKTDKYLIYTSPDYCLHENLPEVIKKHLSKYMPIIKETVDNPPYLHRSRELSIFQGEKIVVPYRTKKNKFGYTNKEWFGAQDVYFITAKSKGAFSIKALLGLLNSTVYFKWLWSMGKRKGDMLELMNTPLMNVPLPRLSNSQMSRLESYVNKLIIKSSVTEEDIGKLDVIVNSILESVDLPEVKAAA